MNSLGKLLSEKCKVLLYNYNSLGHKRDKDGRNFEILTFFSSFHAILVNLHVFTNVLLYGLLMNCSKNLSMLVISKSG